MDCKTIWACILTITWFCSVWILLLACNASCNFASCTILGSTSRSMKFCCIGDSIFLINREDNDVLDRIGESDTKNDAKVVANGASPCYTGVYREELAATPCLGCIFCQESTNGSFKHGWNWGATWVLRFYLDCLVGSYSKVFYCAAVRIVTSQLTCFKWSQPIRPRNSVSQDKKGIFWSRLERDVIARQSQA